MVDGAVSAAGAAARAARALALARSRSVLNAAEAAPSAELELALDCVQALVADEGVRWAADLQPADADEHFGDILRDAADVPHDEAADFASELRRACREVAREHEAAEAERDALPAGSCALCERVMPTTRHHLHPRDEHARLLRRGVKTRAQLNATVPMCRPCHDCVHEHISNADLADVYNSVEKLLECDSIHRFARWASTQRARKMADGHDVSLKYAK